ncbi:hypothetical protein GW755_00060 [bacterium]|nr:hypothetical protein [bacterium]
MQLNSVSKDVSEPTVNTPGGGGEEEKILDTIKQSTNTNTEQIERDLKDLEGQLDLDFSIDDIAP